MRPGTRTAGPEVRARAFTSDWPEAMRLTRGRGGGASQEAGGPEGDGDDDSERSDWPESEAGSEAKRQARGGQPARGAGPWQHEVRSQGFEVTRNSTREPECPGSGRREGHRSR